MTESTKTKTKAALAEEVSALKRRVAELEETLRLLNAACHIAHIGVWEHDAATKNTLWSDGLYRLFGYEPGDIQVDADTYLNRVHPEDRPLIDAVRKDCVSSQKTFAECDYRVVLTSGEERSIHSKTEITYAPDGSPLSLFGAVQDVTEGKQAEERLRKSEEKFRSIMENNPIGMTITNEDGACIDANPTAVKYFGYDSKEDFTRVPVSSHYYDLNDRKKLYESLRRDGNVKDFQVTARRKDGSLFPCSLTSALMWTRDGKTELLTMFEDITERKRYEEELKKTAELLNEAQGIAQMGSWEWDIISGRVIWSDEVYRIFGYRPGELRVTYDAFLSMIYPDDREPVRKAVDEAVYGKKPYSIDHRIVLPDGPERSVHERGAVSLDADGRPVRMIGTVHDITEKMKMDAELLKAQKLESIGTLAGGIAHDFNNLLLGIVGNISLAKNLVSPDDKIYKILNNAEKTAMRTKDLTRQLLTFSRGGEPVRESAPVVQLIKDCAGLVMRGSKIECRFAFSNDLCHVEMDEGQISQVFNNVMLNARHAMPDGGVLEVSAANARVTEADGLPVPGGDYVRVTVKDSGPGIQPKIIHKVFDPFFTTKERASGLGLAISYSIIKKHGGHIRVESKEGSGAAFHIYIHVATKPVSQAATDEKPALGTGKVLVMDDEELVRDVSGEMLKILGYSAEFAADGHQAVDLYRKAHEAGAPYAAVIMDLSIPGGMGGKEAISRLIEIDPWVKAIVSSGYSKDPIMSDYGKYGFAAVIAKPYRVSEFSKVVKAVVAGKS